MTLFQTILVWVLEGTGETVFSDLNTDHRPVEGDIVSYTDSAGATTQYKVEGHGVALVPAGRG
jgi:hypothetical protein|tara:strand:+ start:16786 stop:16974 length:189 start_codon:yes stop_codon:yes gene_type:complete